MKYLILVFIMFSTISFSAEKDGIQFPDQVTVEGKTLTLNGIGIRKATIFKVKVYYGGLYIEQKTKDANTFLTTNSPKQIIMNFVHDVEAKKLRGGFNDGLEAANKDYKSFTSPMEKFNSSLEDVISGDKVVITFLPDGVIVNFKGKLKEKILGKEFSQALLNIWFINPGDKGLRDGLLSL